MLLGAPILEAQLMPRPRSAPPPIIKLLDGRQRRAVRADVRDLRPGPQPPRLRLTRAVIGDAERDLSYINRFPAGFGGVAEDLKAAAGSIAQPFVERGTKEIAEIKGKLDDVALLLKISTGAAVLSALIAFARR